MILDIEHFKKVNDTWGHAVGDECLKSLSHILARSIRSDDLVGRLGSWAVGRGGKVILHPNYCSHFLLMRPLSIRGTTFSIRPLQYPSGRVK
ncbi:diguanylate cyclase [Octadecabacter antarcticus]|uniref:diguanylate cyclase n=1 Tax=Octadecabacter antarcticus TaxID=1217908 RepID=UPI000A01E49B